MLALLTRNLLFLAAVAFVVMGALDRADPAPPPMLVRPVLNPRASEIV